MATIKQINANRKNAPIIYKTIDILIMTKKYDEINLVLFLDNFEYYFVLK